MRIQRLYTAAGHDSYAALHFSTITLELTGDDTADTMTLPVEVPANWPYQSVTTLAAHALRLRDVPKRLTKIKETGVPVWLWRSSAAEKSKSDPEKSFKQIFDRVAGALTYAGWKDGYFATKTDAQTFYDELRYMLASQKLAFAPRLYGLTGLYWAYGLTGDLDNGVWLDPHSNRLRTRVLQYEQPLLANAPATPVVDFTAPACVDLFALKQAETIETTIFAMGRRLLQQHLATLYHAAQTGDDLPGHTTRTEAAGVPPKLVQDVLLAARMGIPCPQAPVHPLHQALTVHDQHFVRVTESALREPGDRWHDLLATIWQHNDPGLFFAAKNTTTDNTSGATLNLAAFVRDDGIGAGGFDHTGFIHVCKLATIALDIALGQTSYRNETAARQARQDRTIGLGFANLAPLLLALGHAYDSASGRATAASIAAIMTGTALTSSATLAAQCGPAPAFKESREGVLRQLRRHRRAVFGAPEKHEPAGIILEDCTDLTLIAAARRIWDQAIDMATASGLRNMGVSSIPDAATLRDFLGAECSGIAPLQRLAHDQQTGADTFIRAPLPEAAMALDNLGYAPETQKMILAALLTYETGAALPADLQAWHHAIFSTRDSTGEGSLSPTAIIGMAGAVQPFITGHVTTSLPLPEHTSISMLDEYIRMAATAGLKNLRCLRAGSQLDSFETAPGIMPILPTSVAVADRPFGALTTRTAERGYARANFRAVREGDPTQARLRVRISAATPVIEKLN